VGRKSKKGRKFIRRGRLQKTAKARRGGIRGVVTQENRNSSAKKVTKSIQKEPMDLMTALRFTRKNNPTKERGEIVPECGGRGNKNVD